MNEERRARLMALPGYIVLGRRPGQNAYFGVIEGSFSLGTSDDRTQFFWSSDNATSNFGGTFVIDGLKDAEEMKAYHEGRMPDVEFSIFDARDHDALPVVLDWDSWLQANEPADTLSGVRDKYGARNLLFRMKEDPG